MDDNTKLTMATFLPDSTFFGPFVDSTDIFRENTLRSFQTLMTKLRPNASSPMWSLVQTIYAENPGRFTLTATYHQNSSTDRLHFSVEVHLAWGRMTMHVYGYWKNFFIITDTSLMVDGREVAVVGFVKTD